ncbi:30S ribosomal protein S12 methylthiotransferase RimO [Pelotomaculum propionicicum]|uniref:Ribosomal protein uS12 methylthiotransferase RimO n=1 Tax=Pelotomaculum propionicicum TaxID=258475 RepID=A0A4Y7RLZ5_9FIRM|nr:30S ribosomal protein S12 methylthiotransferase RimO [Pelotomaculum propionicicum]NLI12662.1 30S ribosomal protein S12 methylthiotransferase RimO [Peptococcaceae bacterium]TEB09760.1 Ribosomal protein S12 methylthiotransferase RimO [Pelotomaculum propionicicum]
MVLKVGLVSLGCPKNLVDSEVMLGLIKDAGYEVTGSEQEADILVVNTCSFINDAKEESIKTIFEMARHKDEGSCRVLLVTGCLAQRYPRQLLNEIPEIDGLIGTGALPGITAAIRQALAGERVLMVNEPGHLNTGANPRLLATPAYSAYLKIAEGCDNRCSYCTIPQVRGPYKSRTIEDVISEAAGLARQGVKELILVAQDTTRYGIDLYGEPALDDLLLGLDRVEELVWLRLLYTYPTLFSDKLIQALASTGKLCRYLDLPLQHAADTVLRRMNRRVGIQEITRLLEKLRGAIPGLTLRTSFIVGFPGETEDEFQELLDFMTKIKFERVGIFAYSREEGTPAAAMPGQVPEEVKLARRDKAMALQKNISMEINQGKIGEEISVLVERRRNKKLRVYEGRSEGDAPDIDGKVIFKSSKDLEPGSFVRVLIKSASPYDLEGELVT